MLFDLMLKTTVEWQNQYYGCRKELLAAKEDVKRCKEAEDFTVSCIRDGVKDFLIRQSDEQTLRNTILFMLVERVQRLEESLTAFELKIKECGLALQHGQSGLPEEN